MHLNKKGYLYQRKIAMIQKAHLPLQLQIQRINNQAIDEMILDYYDENELEEYTSPKLNKERILYEISKLNRIATARDFERLMERSFVTQNQITRLEQINASRKISDRITQLEVERINKNLQTIEKTLDQASLNIDKYKSLIDKIPKTVSRQDVLEKALEEKENFRGRKYSYKELSKLSRDLEKYKSSHIDYEQALIDNRQADREGLPPVWTKKIWHWSTLKDTRHSQMDEKETNSLSEKFTVINERNGKVDYLRFPHDVENDRNYCSNLCNCACWYEIQ